MAKLLKLRRGTTSQHSSFTGAEGELTVDTNKDTAVVHDGATAGGRPLLREDLNNMPASGVSAGTYGSSTAIPAITVDAKGRVTGATSTAHDSTTITNGSASVAVASNGPITATGNLDVTAGVDVTGNITATGDITASGDITATGNVSAVNIVPSGTVDGRDVAADGTKLDGIESSATADQTAAEVRSLVESASDSNVFTDADHTKLNGIEASATADQSAADILTLIKTVDGDGTGLDADLLDGINASSFIRSDTADTATGDITFSGGAGAVSLAGGSDIRLTTGSWTGESPGKIQYHNNQFYFQATTGWNFRNAGSANAVSVSYTHLTLPTTPYV